MATATLFDVATPKVPAAAVKKATGGEREVRHWNPNKLEMHPAQPREVFTQRDLVDLRLKMEADTQLVDMICRPHPDEKRAKAGFLQLCSGDRRRQAALLNLKKKDVDADQQEEMKRLGLKEITPWKAVRVSVRDLSEEEAVAAVFADFQSSKGLDIFEIAGSIRYLVDEAGYTIEDAAGVWSIDRSLASRRMTLTELPEQWKQSARLAEAAGKPLSGKVLMVVAAYRDCPPMMKELFAQFKRDASQFATETAAQDTADAVIQRLARPVADGALSWWQFPIDQSHALFDWKSHRDELEIHRIPFTHQLTGGNKRKIGEVAFNKELAEKLQLEAWNKANPADAVPFDEEPEDEPDEDEEDDADEDVSEDTAAASDKSNGKSPKKTKKKKTTGPTKEKEQAAKRQESVTRWVDAWARRWLGYYVADKFLELPYDSEPAGKILMSMLVSSAAAKNRQYELVGENLMEAGVKSKADTESMLISDLPARKKYSEILTQTIIRYFFDGWSGPPTLATGITLWNLATTLGFDAGKEWERLQNYKDEDSDECRGLTAFFSIFKGDELTALGREMGIPAAGYLKTVESAIGKTAKVDAILDHAEILKLPTAIDKALRAIKK